MVEMKRKLLLILLYFIGLSNPVDMIYHVQPWMVIGLLPLAAVFEGSFKFINVVFLQSALIYVLKTSFTDSTALYLKNHDANETDILSGDFSYATEVC